MNLKKENYTAPQKKDQLSETQNKPLQSPLAKQEKAEEDSFGRKIFYILFFFLAAFMFMIFFLACTYNVSMAHTSGSASDVIDDTSSPTSSLNANGL